MSTKNGIYIVLNFESYIWSDLTSVYRGTLCPQPPQPPTLNTNVTKNSTKNFKKLTYAQKIKPNESRAWFRGLFRSLGSKWIQPILELLGRTQSNTHTLYIRSTEMHTVVHCAVEESFRLGSRGTDRRCRRRRHVTWTTVVTPSTPVTLTSLHQYWRVSTVSAYCPLTRSQTPTSCLGRCQETACHRVCVTARTSHNGYLSQYPLPGRSPVPR